LDTSQENLNSSGKIKFSDCFYRAPLLYGILLGYVYGKGKVTDLPIIVVDEDRSEMSSKAMQMFDDNEVLDITSLLYDQNNLPKLS
jgi:ABC-2 type transport system permease protein